MWLDWISRQTDRTRSPLHWFFYWQLYNDKAKFQWSSLRHRTHLLAFHEFELYCTVKNHTDRCPQYHARIVHDDVIKRKHFPRYWPRVRGIHRSPVNSPHTGQWRGTLMFSLISGWINGWVDNREAGDLRRHRGHYDVIVMSKCNYSHGISHDNVLSWKPTGLKSWNILSRLTWEFILVSFYYHLDQFAYSCASLSFHSPWLRFTSGFDTNKEIIPHFLKSRQGSHGYCWGWVTRPIIRPVIFPVCQNYWSTYQSLNMTFILWQGSPQLRC